MTETAKAPMSHALIAREKLKKHGILLPRQTVKGPVELPVDLDDLSPSAVTQLMNRCSQHMAYVKRCLVLAAISHRQHADRYRRKADMLELEMLANNPRAQVTRVRKVIGTREDMVALNERVLTLAAERELLETVYDAAVQAYTVLSRELTRLTSSPNTRMSDL